MLQSGSQFTLQTDETKALEHLLKLAGARVHRERGRFPPPSVRAGGKGMLAPPSLPLYTPGPGLSTLSFLGGKQTGNNTFL